MASLSSTINNSGSHAKYFFYSPLMGLFALYFTFVSRLYIAGNIFKAITYSSN
jgi:hypothetical protein